MRGALRTTLRLVVGSTAVILVLVGLLWIAIQSPWPKDWLRREIETRASAALRGDVTIQRLEGDLLTRVVLHGVRLHDDGQDVVRIERATVAYSLADLIGGDVGIALVKLERPVVLAQEQEQGWNLARLAAEPPDETKEAGSVAIHRIEVDDGTLILRPATSDGDAVRLPSRIEGIDARLSFQSDSGQTRIAIVRLHGWARDPDLRLSEAAGVVTMREDAFEVSDAQIVAGASRITLSAASDSTSSPARLNGRFETAPLVLAEIAPFVPALEGRRLSPHLRATVEGRLDALRIAGDASDSAAGGIQWQLDADVEGRRRWVKGSIELDDLDLQPALAGDRTHTQLTGTLSVDLHLDGAPSLDHVTGTLSAETQAIEMGGYRLESLDARVRLEGGRASGRLAAAAYGSRWTMTGRASRLDDDPSYSLEGRASGVDLSVLPPALGLPALESRLSSRFELVGEGANVSVHLGLSRSSLEGAIVGDGTDAWLSMADGAITYGVDGRIANVDVPRWGRALDIEALSNARYSSQLTGLLTVRGRGGGERDTRVEATGGLETGSAMAGAQVDAPLAFAVRFDRGQLTFSSTTEDLAVDLSRAAVGESLSGELRGSVDLAMILDLSGETLGVDDVRGQIELGLKPSAIGSVTIDEGRVSASYGDGVLHIASLTARGPAFDGSASGALTLAGGGVSALTYRASVGRLAALGPLVGYDLAGSATIEGRVSGTGGRQRIAGRLDVSAPRVGAAAEALVLQVSHDLEMRDLVDAETLTGHVEIDAQRPVIAGRDLRALDVALDYQAHTLRFEANVAENGRTTTALGRLVRHADHDEIIVDRLAVETENASWATPQDRTLTLRRRDGLLEIDGAQLISRGGRLVAEGTLALDAEHDGALDVRADSIDLHDLGAALLLDLALQGQLDATMHIAGTTRDRVVDGTLTMTDVAVGGAGFERLEAEVRSVGHGLRIDSTLVQSPESTLTVRGRMPLDGDAALDLKVNAASIRLDLLGELIAGVDDVGGTLDASVALEGTGAHPRANGRVSVRQGRFAVGASGTSYDELDLALRLDGDTLTIESLSLMDEDDHTLRVTGHVAAAGGALRDFKVEATSSGFKVMDNELGELALNADMTLQGTLSAPELGGTLRVHSGVFEVDAFLDRVMGPRATVDEAAQAPTRGGPGALSPLDALRVDMTLEVPDNVVLRGSGIRPDPEALPIGDLHVTVGGSLAVSKDPGGELVVRGEARAVRGTYELYGRRFDVQPEGTVRFVGASPPDPALDLCGQRVIAGVVAHVHVAGTAQNPRIELSSDPPLDQADVLSLIVFNRPANQLGDGERADLGKRAASLASGIVVSPLAESLGRALSLDLFEVETMTDGGAGPAVTLGEQLGERIFVRVRQHFGSNNVSELVLSLRLTDYLRLRGTLAEGLGSLSDRALGKRIERGSADAVLTLTY